MARGFTHFKIKVGKDVESDLRRGRIVRKAIDETETGGATKNLGKGKNAGPTGKVLMVDANQVWDVGQAINYMEKLAELKPW
jgi:L-fuconate dehydratase